MYLMHYYNKLEIRNQEQLSEICFQLETSLEPENKRDLSGI